MTDEEKKSREDLVKEWEPVCKEIKKILDSKVISVNISDRLSKNPCVLVSDKYGWSPNMERIMKAQALRANDMMGYMSGRRILEINPSHDILKGLREMVEKGKEKQAASIITMLYETVMLDSGFSLEEPSKYAQKIYRMISLGMSGEDLDPENKKEEGEKANEGESMNESEDAKEGEMEKLD
jgi:molecular chaperone HtpG